MLGCPCPLFIGVAMHLSNILLYPIKSLDGIAVETASILPGGSLAHDREFALVDEMGRVVNAKRTAQIQRIRSTYDLAARTVTLGVQGEYSRQTFHLDHERSLLEAWFSDYFGYPVWLQQNLHMGFPDDTDASGPTLVSVATLETVAAWFPGSTLEEMRDRFRSNLEIAGTPPFWEDQLLAKPGEVVPFQIGEVTLLGNNPCQRCVVPTRHPQTAAVTAQFQNRFSALRSETLPDWAPISRFNHFYKLTLNTKVPTTEAGKVLRLGDGVKLAVSPEQP